MKRGVVITLILLGVFCVWLYTGRWTEVYQEQNGNFEVAGVILDAVVKRPISNVDVQVSCAEALTRDHKWRGAPRLSTNYVVKSDEHGAFGVKGFGGRLGLAFECPGYSERYWAYHMYGDQLRITTNLVIELFPLPKKHSTH